MKRTILAVSLFVLGMFFVPPAPPARADGTRVTYYTVRYACIVSPSMYGHIEGQWEEDCCGNVTGWGWQPGHNCTYTDVTWGDFCPVQPPDGCYGGGGGGGEDPPFEQ